MHFCAGTIIKNYWILTAAHCFTYIIQPEEFHIQYNTTHLNPTHPQYAHVLELRKHEGFSSTIAINDIALIKLKDPIYLGSNVSELKIPTDENKIYGNSKVTLIGWGLNKNNGVLANELEKVSLDIITLDECRKQLKSVVHASNICSGGVHRGQCSGDSGGPLLHENMQIGLASWSLKPCGTKPGVFINLSFYKKWIEQHLGK